MAGDATKGKRQTSCDAKVSSIHVVDRPEPMCWQSFGARVRRPSPCAPSQTNAPCCVGWRPRRSAVLVRPAALLGTESAPHSMRTTTRRVGGVGRSENAQINRKAENLAERPQCDEMRVRGRKIASPSGRDAHGGDASARGGTIVCGDVFELTFRASVPCGHSSMARPICNDIRKCSRTLRRPEHRRGSGCSIVRQGSAD